MATMKTRVNVSLPKEIKEALDQLAKRDQMPVATKAEHLLEIGLELEEDLVWDEIAAHRDNADAQFLTHEQVFKV